MVRRPDVREDGATSRQTTDGLELTFQQLNGLFEASSHALSLPRSWEPYSHLVITLRNGDEPADLTATVVGARNRIMVPQRFETGETAEIRVDLIDLPLAQGNRPMYEPSGVRISAAWGNVRRTEGEQILAGEPYIPESELRVHVLDIKLVAAAGPSRPCVDRFFQRVNGDWPTKIRSEEHLRSVIDAENAMLEKVKPHPERDVYGGWTGGPSFEASGFFRVEQDDADRWWYVDPLGNPFWSFGTTGVRSSEPNTLAWTRTKGREHLFESLPDPDSELGRQVYCEKGFSCYAANVLRKWGSKERWRQQVLGRFKAWGLNTIGNWSEEIILRQQEVPFTRALDMPREGFSTLGKHMPDAWDPRWAEALDRYFAEHAAPCKDDPWLVGYFVDNEIGWSPHLALRGEPGCPARRRWVAFVKERLGTVEACNATFGFACSSWEEIESVPLEEVSIEGEAGDLLRELTGEHAERYFGTIAETLKRHDPNHLYMGCRFTRRKKDRLVLEATGRHCDVVSFNFYGLAPEADEVGKIYEECGRPLQIGEHHIPLRSERQLAPLYPSFTAQERRDLVPRFVETWAAQPYAVGSHWYQHGDQMPTGRYTNGENQTVGLMDITDQPHPELVGAFREISAHIYHWHADAGRPALVHADS